MSHNQQRLGADRIAFKQWAASRGFNTLRARDGDRLYVDSLTETVWQGWKAACEWKSSGKVDDCGLKVSEGMLAAADAAMKDGPSQGYGRFDTLRRGLEAALAHEDYEDAEGQVPVAQRAG